MSPNMKTGLAAFHPAYYFDIQQAVTAFFVICVIR